MPLELRRLKRGEQLSGIPGKTWNSFCDTAEIVARSGLAGIQGLGLAGNPVVLDVQNNCGSARLVGEVFGIDDIVLDKMDQIVAEGINPVMDHWTGLIAIAATPSADGGISRCVVSGLVRAVVDVTDTEIRTVDLTNGDGTVLTSHLAGRARLVVPATSTGEQDAWVLLGGSRQIDWTGVASGTITAGGTGTVTIDGLTGVSVTASLDKMHGDQDISSGKEVAVKWFDWEQIWRVMHAECED